MFQIWMSDEVFSDSPNAGEPDCRCSRCGNLIGEDDNPMRLFDTEANTERRYCNGCVYLDYVQPRATVEAQLRYLDALEQESPDGSPHRYFARSIRWGLLALAHFFVETGKGVDLLSWNRVMLDLADGAKLDSEQAERICSQQRQESSHE